MDTNDRRELLQKLTEMLGASELTAKALAKKFDKLKKTDINSILYAAEKCGLVDRIEHETEEGKKGAPTWKTSFVGELTLGVVNDLE